MLCLIRLRYINVQEFVPVLLTVVITRLSCQFTYKVEIDFNPYAKNTMHTNNHKIRSIIHNFLSKTNEIPCAEDNAAYSFPASAMAVQELNEIKIRYLFSNIDL